MKKLKIGIVGLRFGGEFAEIYKAHPAVEKVVLCEQDAALLSEYASVFGYDELFTDYDQMLQTDLDAVHIVTGIPSHHELTVKALRAGKHCACTVPMGVSLEELFDIIRAQAESGKQYMMMETSIYTFQCFYAKKMLEKGEFQNIQYMRGIYFQDMDGWPAYWTGLPPMHYATHAVSPLLYLSKGIPESVICLGSGKMDPRLQEKYGNPYPIETATVQFRDQPYVADLTRSLFETAHEYVEGFTILSDRASFEWNVENEPPRISVFQEGKDCTNMGSRGRRIHTYDAHCENMEELLPKEIQEYTRHCTILDPKHPHNSIQQGGSHHGSHPNMVHEFLSSILENRKPETDAVTSAYWTAVGICAHLSATQNGARIPIPDFEEFSAQLSSHTV